MSTSDYELIYWPGIPGRGEFIRLVFEEAGVPYTDKAVADADAAVNEVLKLTGDNVGNEINPPFFAPPILRHNNLLISQTPNILQYIAPRVGLGPAEGPGVYHINGLVLTILDGLSNEAHDTHHPIAVGLYYEEQKEESKRRAKDYTSARVPKFLGHLQKVLEGKKSGDGPWLYDGELTYADLVLFQSLDGLKFAFPNALGKLEKSGKYDRVFKLYEAVKERPNIKKYLASDRRQKYGDGIYRQYPELDSN